MSAPGRPESSYRCAQHAGCAASPPTHVAGAPLARVPVRGRALVPAVILIVLGTLFLLGNLGLIPRLGPLLAQWWPLILIVVGASLLLRR